MVREVRVVLRALLQEGVPPLLGLIRPVGQPGGLAGEDLLATPENFGYMSGALKDFFDRTYYPCLEHTRGRPYGLMVKAGGDGSGAVAAVVPLATGLEWRSVLEPLVISGDVTAEHLVAARELGGSLAAGLAGDLW